MLTKESAIQLLNELYVYSCYNANQKEITDLKMNVGMLKQLINEHFDNSTDFNHFKLYADSTLKTFKKDELIDYIHMLYHNWQSTDWYYNNTVKVNYKLQSEVDELKSNPPLKFEEIKEGMWVWDNKFKSYYKVKCTNVCEYLYTSVEFTDSTEDVFEENRFYRKQVEK